MSTAGPLITDPMAGYAKAGDQDANVDGAQGKRLLRYIDWIWHIRGSVPLAPGQSNDDAFDRLDSLFHERGTTYERTSDTLTFRKKDPVAQDKMSVFDSGVLRIENDATGPVMRYHLISRALLFCLFMPLFFLGMAQVMIAITSYEKAHAKVETKAEKAEAAKKKAEAEKKMANFKLHPLDAALGAPVPDKNKKKKKREKLSPTPAYVLAGIFATLYLVGRLLEDWLIKSVFRRRLQG